MASGPAKFVQEGGAIDYTPGADVLVGAVVVQADLIGVTQAPIKSGQLGSLAVTGVFDFPKAVGVGSGHPRGHADVLGRDLPRTPPRTRPPARTS